MLNAELHGVRAGTWPAGEVKERSREKSKEAVECSHKTKRMWEETAVENDEMMG